MLSLSEVLSVQCLPYLQPDLHGGICSWHCAVSGMEKAALFVGETQPACCQALHAWASIATMEGGPMRQAEYHMHLSCMPRTARCD